MSAPKREADPDGPTPLDITARYLRYPKVLVDYLKAKGYEGRWWLPGSGIKAPAEPRGSKK